MHSRPWQNRCHPNDETEFLPQTGRRAEMQPVLENKKEESLRFSPDYFVPSSPRPGSGWVFSACTDFNCSLSIPSSSKMVGATCEVATGLFTTFAARLELETINATFVSL